MEEGLAVGKVGPRGPGASVPSHPKGQSCVSTTVRRAGDVRIESSRLTPSSVRPCNVRASSPPPASPVVLFFVLSRFSVFFLSFVSMKIVDWIEIFSGGPRGPAIRSFLGFVQVSFPGR